MSQDSFQGPDGRWASLAEIVDVAAQFHRLFPRRGLDGLSSSELQVIVVIHVWPGLTPGQIAETLQLEKNSISKSLRNLAEAELTVAKTEDDRRSRTIYLTESGEDLVGRFAEPIFEATGQ